MTSDGGDQVIFSRDEKAVCSDATVEIKIKTLDSHTYTLRVDKCVPVPALKDQIAIVTGVLSNQQRLICRGRVLKDDQLLSSYHVEDGHTLHLVVRDPHLSQPGSLPDHPGTDHAYAGIGRGRPGVVVGAFNVSEQVDGGLPDLSRIVSAVINSFGGTNNGSGGGEGADLREHARIHNVGGIIDISRQQPVEAGRRGQSDSTNISSSLPNVGPFEHLPLVIPDSLTTLSHYLNRMRHEFGFGVGGIGNGSQDADIHAGHVLEPNAATRSISGHGGLPTPGSLAEAMLSTRQLLTEQAGECLTQLARQLEEHNAITDPSARMTIQSNAMRSGDLLQKLGALLFELGRTTMTLRMGQEPSDAVVNAGPAMFITTSGPNPLMVQPVPFLQGSSFGAAPFGNVQTSSAFSGGNHPTGLHPTNIDIRIQAGSLTQPIIGNQGETNDAFQSIGQNNSSPSLAHPVNQGPIIPGAPSSIREHEVRVLPIRTVVTAVPSVRLAPPDSSRGPVGMFYPVLTSVQQTTNENLNNGRGFQTSNDQHPTFHTAAGQQNIESTVRQASRQHSEEHGNSNSRDGAAVSSQVHGRLDQLIRTLFPGEQIQVEVNVESEGDGWQAGGMAEVGGGDGGPVQSESLPPPTVTEEAFFLSNMLQHVLPLISENTVMAEASDSAADINGNPSDPSTQGNSGVGASESNPPSPPNSKRQKRE